jgi:hypothetical protein
VIVGFTPLCRALVFHIEIWPDAMSTHKQHGGGLGRRPPRNSRYGVALALKYEGGC